MSSGLDQTELTDHQLVDLARAGNTDAFGTLFRRHHYAARRLARHIAPQSDTDDIVAEAFAAVLDQLSHGRGPTLAFRSYLLTTVRHEAGRRLKSRARVQVTDDDRQIDTVVPFHDTVLADFERSTVGAAYQSLPDRWREVLWQLDVEGRKPHEIAPELGMKPNGVSALVYRARAKLREAYVQEHLSGLPDSSSSECREARDRFAGRMLGSLSRRDHAKVQTHLDSCAECRRLMLELQEVGASPSTYHAGLSIAPVALGPDAAASAWHGATRAARRTVDAGRALVTTLRTPIAALALTGAAVVAGMAAPSLLHEGQTQHYTAVGSTGTASGTDVTSASGH